MNEQLATLYEVIKRRAIPMNSNRKICGLGRSVTFGHLNRRYYKGLHESVWNSKRPDLYKELCALGDLIAPRGMDKVGIQVNHNYRCNAHKDKNNQGTSVIVAFGDFTGGELRVENDVIDINGKPYEFDGSVCEHETLPFEGDRYSVVYFYHK